MIRKCYKFYTLIMTLMWVMAAMTASAFAGRRYVDCCQPHYRRCLHKNCRHQYGAGRFNVRRCRDRSKNFK